jgi:spore germination protein GerM
MRARPAGAVVVATALLLAGCRQERGEDAAAAGAKPTPTERAVLALHFPAVDGYLHLERREMDVPAVPDARLEAVLTALLAGPRQAGLSPLFDSGVKMGNAFVDSHGVAYIDLAAEGQPSPPPSGSALELVRVFGVVNTVLANDSRARGVVLLWNGTQRQTFAGHVDTLHPLTANSRLVR